MQKSVKTNKSADIIPFHGNGRCYRPTVTAKTTTPTYNKAAMDILFLENAIYLWDGDVVPEYRLIELFGARVVEIFDSALTYTTDNPDTKHFHTCMVDGCEKYRYVDYSGFRHVISRINAQTLSDLYTESIGKISFDEVRAVQEAEAERKREERRAKRAASKATKEQLKAMA